MRRLSKLLALAAALALAPFTAHAQQGGFYSDTISGEILLTNINGNTLTFNVEYASPDCLADLKLEFQFQDPNGTWWDIGGTLTMNSSTPSTGSSYNSSISSVESSNGCGSVNVSWDREAAFNGSFPDETPFEKTPIRVIATVDDIETGGYSDPSVFSKRLSNLLMLDHFYGTNSYQTIGKAEPITTSNLSGAGTGRPANTLDDSGNEKLWYAPLAVQATYDDNTWEDNIADRTVQAVGANIVIFTNYTTGPDETRTLDAEAYAFPSLDGFEAKYSTPISTYAVISQGGTYFDAFRAIGSITRAIAAFDSPSNNYVHSLIGSVGQTMLGKVPPKDELDNFLTTSYPLEKRKVSDIALFETTSSAYGFHAHGGAPIIDLREQPITDANSTTLATIFADPVASGSGDRGYPDSTGPYRRRGGYLHRVTANEHIVASSTNDSYINVTEATGAITQLSLNENEGTSNFNDPGQDQLPRIFQEYMSVEAFPLTFFRKDIGINIYNTLLVRSQLTGGEGERGHGGTVREAPFIRSSTSDAKYFYETQEATSPASNYFPYEKFEPTTPDIIATDYFPPEHKATILAQDSVIIGDGISVNKGIDADGVVVKSMRLTPRNDDPIVHERLPAPDRVGLIYYDLLRNRIRLSVAAPNTTSSPPKPKAIAWVDLNFDDTTDLESDAADLRKHAHPKMTGTYSSGDIVLTITGMFKSDGTLDEPGTLFWRRIPFGTEGRGETLWKPLTVSGTASSDSYTITISSSTFTGAAAGLDEEVGKTGQIIEFMVFSTEDEVRCRAAGTSLSIL